MESTVVETVITELLEEQKVTNRLHREQLEKMDELTKKVESFAGKLDQQKVIAPPADTVPIQKIMIRGMQEVSKIVEGQPKNVIRQVRLLLFPEMNTDRYYRLVFGRLVPWTGLFITAVLFISLGRQYIISRTALQERRYYYDAYLDAWNRLDTTVDRTTRIKMKQALQKAANAHHKDE